MRHAQVLFSTLAAIAVVIATPFPEAVETPDVQPVDYVAISKTDGRISATSGSPNGLYIVHNDTHAAFYGEVSTDQLAFLRSLPVPAEFTCDPSCNGQQHSASDISTAESGLAGWFSSGFSWSGSIYYFYNSVYAFGCDYGHGQKVTASDYWAAVGCVDDRCTSTQGGWDNIHDWKVTYGREFGSFGC